MPIELYYPLSPRGKPWIVEDLHKIKKKYGQEVYDEIESMVEDFRQKGNDSRYVKALKYKKKPTIIELKTTARGGFRGGARVYFFWVDGCAVICGAECKHANDPSDALLTRLKRIYKGEI